MKAKEVMIQKFLEMHGRYSASEIFSDWVRCCALVVSNFTAPHDDLWEEREKEYLETMRKYNKDEQVTFAELLAFLTEALEEEMSDVLGEVYMKAEMGSKSTGQFFTPFHVSELCARLGLGWKELAPDEDGIYRIHEPSCGAGGMIIAACKALKDAGINYQKNVEVIAQDLDWRGVYMTYLQLSLLGVKAIVVQGDTLKEPYVPGITPSDRIFVTPGKIGVLI